MFLRRKRTSKTRGRGEGGTQSVQSSPVSSSDLNSKTMPRSGEVQAVPSDTADDCITDSPHERVMITEMFRNIR